MCCVQVECEKMAQLPNISFDIGGRTFELSPEQYILKVCGCTLCLSGAVHYVLVTCPELISMAPLIMCWCWCTTWM